MIYTDIAEKKNIKPGTKIWACAYSFHKNKETMGLIQEPVYGITRSRSITWGKDDLNESYSSFFVPFRKGSDSQLAKSKEVSIWARCFADTYEECVELYNRMVNERVDWFLKRVEETRGDLLEVAESD